MSTLLVTPRATEKAYGLSKSDRYVFDVPVTSNKQQIKNAIETQYGVTVVRITTLIQSGKAIRFVKAKRAYPGTTHRKDKKKAYVTLKDGDKIKVFEEAPVEKEKK
jgi:large subunit ribosomal protein L23